MNRRSLLKFLALGVIGHELDIDRLLWLPGQKTIFLPPLPKLTIFSNPLYGIPYHDYTIHCTGEWLGIPRNEEAVKELIKFVGKLKEGK